jgi:hypothetical protein
MIKSISASTDAAITLGINIHMSKADGVSTAVYVVYIVMQCYSLLFGALFITNPRKAIRDDGTHLAIFKSPTLKQEMKALRWCFINKHLLILLLAMLVCEMALALVSAINGKFLSRSIRVTC